MDPADAKDLAVEMVQPNAEVLDQVIEPKAVAADEKLKVAANEKTDEEQPGEAPIVLTEAEQNAQQIAEVQLEISELEIKIDKLKLEFAQFGKSELCIHCD